MAYTTIDDPEKFFQVKTYTGNGSTQSITFDGTSDMQPNMNWTKVRSETGSHRLTDDIRGLNKPVFPNGSDAEGTEDNYTSFDSDGFSLKNASVNENTRTYVAWCWKTGTAFSNDASATSIGSLDSSGSVNTTSGFSIVSFTGNQTSGATIKHGLTSAPEWIMSKDRGSNAWYCYHVGKGNGHALRLSTTDGPDDSTGYWNDTTPGSSTYTVGDNTGTNDSNTMIAFHWHSVQGYSKMGSYTGNGDNNGTFVFTGFSPAWIMIKKNDTGPWGINDTKRDFNDEYGNDASVYANTTGAESTSGSLNVDFLSNGFKLRSDNAEYNANGGSYVFIAFADSPFVNSNKIPNNARQ